MVNEVVRVVQQVRIDTRARIRAQYHARRTDTGLLVWDVRRLVTLAANLPVEEVPLARISELDECYWFDEEGDSPTVRRIAEHARLIAEADLHFPILLCADGRVMDGMHRAAKALLAGASSITARRFMQTPAPDYIDVDLADLPYDE